jgi:hypothetical protein
MSNLILKKNTFFLLLEFKHSLINIITSIKFNGNMHINASASLSYFGVFKKYRIIINKHYELIDIF